MIRSLGLSAVTTLGLALSAPAVAQVYPPAPALRAPSPFQLPPVETYTLANGLVVTLVPFGLAPKVSVQLTVDAGSLNAGHDAGLASLSASMLKEGTTSRNAVQIARAAAGMGGDLSIGSGRHQTNLYLNVLSDQAGAAIMLVGDVAIHPSFPASAFDRVKADAARNLAVTLSQAGSIADYALARAYYGSDHPYGNIPSTTQIAAFTIADARRFHDINFGARRAHLYIAGRFDKAAVKAAIMQAFGGWTAGPARLALPPHPKSGPQLILVDRPGAPQSTIRLTYKVPPETDPAAHRLEVMDALLSGSFGSRITKNLREDKGYTYSPYSYLDYRPFDGTWTMAADVTTAVTGASFHEIFTEIRRLQDQAPGEPEAMGMRTYLTGLFVLQNSTAQGIAASLADRDFKGLAADWLDRYVPGVLAVTTADIQDEARKNLPVADPTVIVVGDLAKVRGQLEAQSELKGIPFQTMTVPPS
jgi:predicted Zn-dependent peptidase